MPDVLLDSGVLLRVADVRNPEYAALWTAIKAIEAQGNRMVFFNQNAVESWNVLTRPVAGGGYALSPADARRTLIRATHLFARLPDPPGLFDRWLDLVTDHAVIGRQVHDARLVASMLESSVGTIATMNARDFRRFESEGVVVLDMTPQPGAA